MLELVPPFSLFSITPAEHVAMMTKAAPNILPLKLSLKGENLLHACKAIQES